MRSYQVRGAAHLPFAEVVDHVAFELDRDAAEIFSASRQRRLAWARTIIAMLARRYTDLTFSQIGAAMGGRPGGSIGQAVERGSKLFQDDGYFRHLVEHIDALLRPEGSAMLSFAERLQHSRAAACVTCSGDRA